MMTQKFSLAHLTVLGCPPPEMTYIAAMAGYDPQVAVNFWQRMSAASSNKTAEFLSSHPSDETRISQIQGWMPEALKYYKPQTTTTTTKTTTKKTTSTKKTTTKKTTKK